MTTVKNDAFFIGFSSLLVCGGGEGRGGVNKHLVGRGYMSKFLVGGGTSPSPQEGKPCINFANRVLYTMKKLRAHHVPNRQS